MSEALPRVRETPKDGRLFRAAGEPLFVEGECAKAEEDDTVGGGTDKFCGACLQDDVVEEFPLAEMPSAPFLDDVVLFAEVAEVASATSASVAAADLNLLAASSRRAVEPGVSVLETRGTMTLKRLRRDFSSSPGVFVSSVSEDTPCCACPPRIGPMMSSAGNFATEARPAREGEMACGADCSAATQS